MHSCIYVIIGPNTNTDTDTNDIESAVAKALAPFDEALTVAPYKVHLSSSGIRAMAEHYKVPETNLKQLAGKMQDWMRCRGGIDELGLFASLTSNPDGKWDWYEIGGRWDGLITGRKRPNSDVLRNNSIRASTLLRARDFSARIPFSIVTPTGEWVERSTFETTSTGWYTRETPTDVWTAHVRRILAAFPMFRVVCVDTHC